MFKWLILTGRIQQTDSCCMHMSSLRKSKIRSYFLFLKKETLQTPGELLTNRERSLTSRLGLP